MSMFKKFLLLLCILLISVSVFAEIKMIYPVEKTVYDTDSIKLGAVQPGETFQVVVLKKNGDKKWQDVSVDTELLPGWIVKKEVFDKSFSLFFSVPANLEETYQNVKITLFDGSLAESFSAGVLIKKNLLSAGIVKFDKETVVGEPVNLKLNLINDSIAQHTVLIKSSLPYYWFSGDKIILKPKTSAVASLIVFPQAYGLRHFSIFVDSAQNNTRFADFDVELNVLPTLRGKYLTSFTGFPLFAPSLFPFYLIDALLAYLS